MQDIDKFHRARRTVEAITGFYIHAVVYVIVNAGLVLINFATSPEWWAHWPIAGWGIGLVAHGIVVYGLRHPRVLAWEERKVREVAARLQTTAAPTATGTASNPDLGGLAPHQPRFRF